MCKATLEYATAEIAVWWDMKDCPIPEGYDAGRVRLSIVGAFKSLGYFGPVSITAYADQTQTPDHVLRGLTSTGVAVAHAISKCRCSRMFSDMLEWRAHHPPPATMMLISDQVEDVFSLDLVRLQQRQQYNLFLAYSVRSRVASVLITSAEWLWEKLLSYKHETTSCTAIFYCKSCSFDFQSLDKFRKHLSSRKHVLEEVGNSGNGDLDPVTRKWGKNYPAKPEYATAPIAVWWDMTDCPIPEDYDACRVRPSIEGAFKSLGYSGPVSITAYGDHKDTPFKILQGLSSSGVAVAHSIFEKTGSRMFMDMWLWRRRNPPPATMMLISDQVEEGFANELVGLQQLTKYNLFLAYSFRPYKTSLLVTSAEWLWDSLLAVSETRGQLLHKCSERERERGESSGTFYCEVCLCDCKGLDNFTKHLSSVQHRSEEASIYNAIEESLDDQQFWLEVNTFPDSEYSEEEEASSPLNSREHLQKYHFSTTTFLNIPLFSLILLYFLRYTILK